MDKLIKVGKIVKAQGIRGEMKVLSMTNTSRFLSFDNIFIDNIQYKVEFVRLGTNANIVFIKVVGIDNRNSAEKFVSKIISIDNSFADKCNSNEYYIDDLVGCTILLDNKPYGILIDIGQYGTADVHFVKTLTGKIIQYPFLKVLIDNIDIQNKVINLIEFEFEKVVVD